MAIFLTAVSTILAGSNGNEMIDAKSNWDAKESEAQCTFVKAWHATENPHSLQRCEDFSRQKKITQRFFNKSRREIPKWSSCHHAQILVKYLSKFEENISSTMTAVLNWRSCQVKANPRNAHVKNDWVNANPRHAQVKNAQVTTSQRNANVKTVLANANAKNAQIKNAQITANHRNAQVKNAQVTTKAKHRNAHMKNVQDNANPKNA